MSRSRSPSQVDVSNLCDGMMQMILIVRDCRLLSDCPREQGNLTGYEPGIPVEQELVPKYDLFLPLGSSQINIAI